MGFGNYVIELSILCSALCSTEEDLLATVESVHVKERVKTKLTKMGFKMNTQVESLVDKHAASRSDVDHIISAIIGEMMKEIN